MKISEIVTHSFTNRDEIERSSKCACFHCFSKFEASDIEYWSDSDDPEDEDPGGLRSDDEGFLGKTAHCPKCEYDSVIGDACGLELTNELLKKLKEYWHRS